MSLPKNVYYLPDLNLMSGPRKMTTLAHPSICYFAFIYNFYLLQFFSSFIYFLYFVFDCFFFFYFLAPPFCISISLIYFQFFFWLNIFTFLRLSLSFLGLSFINFQAIVTVSNLGPSIFAHSGTCHLIVIFHRI